MKVLAAVIVVGVIAGVIVLWMAFKGIELIVKAFKSLYGEEDNE